MCHSQPTQPIVHSAWKQASGFYCCFKICNVIKTWMENICTFSYQSRTGKLLINYCINWYDLFRQSFFIYWMLTDFARSTRNADWALMQTLKAQTCQSSNIYSIIYGFWWFCGIEVVLLCMFGHVVVIQILILEHRNVHHKLCLNITSDLC